MAVIISIIVSILNAELEGIRDILIISGFLLLGFIMLRSSRLVTFFENYLEKNLTRSASFCQMEEDELLNLGDYTVTEVTLTNRNAPLVNRTIKENGLQECGLIVLSIERNGQMIQVPRGSETVLPYDKLLLYGRAGQIKKYTGQAP